MTKCRAFSLRWNFVVAAFFALLGLSAAGPLCAEQSPQSRPKAPVLDADALTMPKAGSAADHAHSSGDRETEAAPKLKAPSFDLGKYDLQFNAGKTSEVNPRTGFDSGEASNLSKINRGKSEGAAPDYFGLKLKVPTH